MTKVSGSVHGERSDKARGEMLKRVQHDQREELHDQQGKQHDKKDYTNHHPDAISHPELVSGSVRGEWSDEARGEMLKRVQHDVKGNGMTRRGPHDQREEQHDKEEYSKKTANNH